MSAPLSREEVLFRQRLLKCCGLYPGKLDGQWGPKTDAAVNAFAAGSEQLAQQHGKFDPGSEKHIATLQLRAQEAARRFLGTVLSAGIPARVISGTRTYEEQNTLFRKGRFGNPGPVVTNARGGQSNHNFGIAWDIGIFVNGKYLKESPLYDQVPTVGLGAGIEWGGAWATFPDRPHYQLVTGRPIGVVRASFEKGTPFV
jgi:peptidoglycan L-alanyl-D-glutamate endopeptidase CwlK